MSAPEPEGVRYRPTRLVLPRGMDVEAFLEILRALGGMARNVQWWAGDALVYAEKTYGDDMAATYADALGLEPHTMVNWRWVADSVAPSRRREDLSWSHHAEVARLHHDAQKTALARAAKEEWTVRQLRDYVAMTWPQSQPGLFGDDDGNGDRRDEVADNRRLEKIELALDSGDDVDADDVRWLVVIARRVIRS